MPLPHARLEALVRESRRTLPPDVQSALVSYFLGDMATLVHGDVIASMSDTGLLANYLLWERVAQEHPRGPDRLEALAKRLVVMVTLAEVATEDETLPDNVVRLFR